MEVIVKYIALLELLTSSTLGAGGGNGNTFTYVKPSSCLLSKNETFSSVNLGCVKCQWEITSTSSTGTGPKSGSDLLFPVNKCHFCPTGYWRTGNVCRHCINGTVSEDFGSCLRCTEVNPFNLTTGKCQPCPEGHIQVTRKPNGSPNTILVCEQCADGLTPSGSTEQCVPCHLSYPKENTTNGSCHCPHTIINGICIPPIPELQFDRKTLYKIRYDTEGYVESSKFLSENLLPAFYLCKAGKNETACQILANSCVLQLYYTGEDNACKLYEQIEKIGKDFDSILPKLSYEELSLVKLQKPDFITKEFSSNFYDPSSNFNITVTRLTATGEFLGLSLLTDLVPCQGQLASKQIKQKFGVTTRSKCQIYVRDLLNLAPGGMEFWNAFLSIESEKQILYSIPIKIVNIRSKIDEDEEKSKGRLVRRFFLVDNLGGIETSINEVVNPDTPHVPKFVRYIEKINVGIQLQQQEDAGRVFAPIITVSYNQFSVEAVTANQKISFTYEIDYFMDMNRAVEDIKISVGVISSLAVLCAAIQTWTWNRRNGRAEIDLDTILTLLLTSCGNIADAFVIVSFSVGLYWWIFFKKQVAVHIFLPMSGQERLIRDLLISAFALKMVDVFKLILRQVTIDIFFVDWEKPKTGSVIQGPNDKSKGHTSAGDGADDKNSVSIWRSYFVANEWNEIQSMRKINLALQIMLALFLLEVLGFKHWGLHWPSATLNPGEEAKDVPYSTVSRFTTSTLIFTLLGILQWICNVGIIERFFSNKIQDFVDICTMANVSVFILAAKQYGYYIHGRSVHGFADTDMRTMVEQLHREEEDLCGRRGLVATYDQQTFIISIPRSLRTVYDQVLQPLYAQSSKLVANAPASASGGSKGSATGISKSGGSQLNQSAHAYHSMNRFLTSFLEHALSDIDYEVSDKSFIECTLDMEFRDTGDRAVFYNDDGHSFDSTIFYGHERTLFLFDLYLFNFVDLLSHNFVLAGIVTFLADILLKCIRESLGKRNLARKTLIDGRFLI